SPNAASGKLPQTTGRQPVLPGTMNTTPIGKPLPRVDGRLKVTGTATYAAEFQRPRLAYGVLIQSAIANGRVVKIDITAAKSAPGVVGILTRENAPGFKPYPEDLTKKGAPGENRMPLQEIGRAHV